MTSRRITTTTLIILAVTAVVPAIAAAETIAIQGVLRTAGNGPVADGVYGMEITLYTDAEASQVTFSEKFIAVEVTGGLFEVVIGADPKLPLDAQAVAAQTSHVGVKVGIEKEMPLVALRAVPRAWRADVAVVALSANEAIHAAKADFATNANSAAAAATADQAKQADFATNANEAAHAVAAETASEAGHALIADLAKEATHAASADKATWAETADKAGSAISAEEATTANVALKLQCTGCVTKEMLGEGVLGNAAQLDAANTFSKAQAFDGGVDFKAKPLSGFRFENAAKDPVVCDAATLGYAYYNTADGALRVCNGMGFVTFAIAIPPGSKANPGTSCKQILAEGGSSGDGVYWIDADGAGGVDAFAVRCDMKTDGGGWTLVWSNTRGGAGKPVTGMKWATAIGTAPLYKGNPADELEKFIVYTGLSHWKGLSPNAQLRYSWSSDYGQPIQQSWQCTYALSGAKWTLALTDCAAVVGNIKPGLIANHNGHNFTTTDQDNDSGGDNCSNNYSGTPWWYESCWGGSIHGGGEQTGSGYYNGAYWIGSSKSWGDPGGTGAGNGWIWIR